MNVYVISCESGPVKIGTSFDPPSRIKQLQTGCPYPLRMEYISDFHCEAEMVEQMVHYALRERRMCGEWFSISTSEAIETVKKWLPVYNFTRNSDNHGKRLETACG